MNNVDSLGLPGAEGEDGLFDGGDTAAILGNVIALRVYTLIVPVGSPPVSPWLLSFLMSNTGKPRRHPDATKWYGKTDRFSRDQLIPVICAGIMLRKEQTIEDFFQAHRQRCFLTAWNTKGNGKIEMPDKFPDITGPEVWALWLRYKKPWFAWMLIWLFDIETLVGAVQWRWFAAPTNRVCRNHMLVCLIGKRHLPTITMRLANWINNWPDLLSRWRAHQAATKEFDTATLFGYAARLDS